MKRRIIAFTLVGFLAAAAGGLLAMSESDYKVGLDSVVEIWGDFARDADHLGLTVTRVSAAREMEIGRKIEALMATSDDPKLAAYVTAVGESLVRHVRRKGISYRFHISPSSHVNAYALPGGGIYITQGMLRVLQTEAELAAVLGHEIAHVDLRHCIERIQYEQLARKVVGDLALIVRIGHELVERGFSEQKELEADVVGMILAAKAGYDPQAAIALFERLNKTWREAHNEAKQPTLIVQELGTALGKALDQYFETHPPTQLRIHELGGAVKRNARAWAGRQFYAGRTNYRDGVPRVSDERENEWVTFAR